MTACLSQSADVEPGTVGFEWQGPPKRVALVHYWLVGMRGGEKVLELLSQMFPDADIYTLVCDFERISPRLRQHKITTSFLQRLGGKKHYQKMLGLMPYALESFDLSAYDLIISSEAGPAKGIVPRPDALHICYCHSPMRYIWDQYYQYRASSGLLTRILMSVLAPRLRQWDVTTSARVDHFIANSRYVARRIEKYYRRTATVIHPPVELSKFATSDVVEDVYLCAGQVTPYKRIDIAVEAFNRMGKRLDIVGGGVSDALRKLAGPTIRFLGVLDDDALAEKFAKSKALIYPGIEDFGIVPLEMMASGRPVIAYAKGGATETVREGVTGLLFHEQTANGIIDAVRRFENGEVCGSIDEIRAHVETFSSQRFVAEMSAFVKGRNLDA